MSEVWDYLWEVFGYREVKDIDTLTLECIKENADEGYPLDQEIMDEWNLLQGTKNV